MRDPRAEYLTVVQQLAEAERVATRLPSTANINRVLALLDEAHRLYVQIPPKARPVPIGRTLKPLSLRPSGPVVRRDRASDYRPMTFRGQDN